MDCTMTAMPAASVDGNMNNKCKWMAFNNHVIALLSVPCDDVYMQYDTPQRSVIYSFALFIYFAMYEWCRQHQHYSILWHNCTSGCLRFHQHVLIIFLESFKKISWPQFLLLWLYADGLYCFGNQKVKTWNVYVTWYTAAVC